nr:hypothetical protein BaRGS_004190 [Batillaria attramentaria]
MLDIAQAMLLPVRDRARQFFRELCELMEHEGSTVDGEYRPASIKAKRQLDAGVSNGSTEREPEAPRISISQNNAECTINHRQSSRNSSFDDADIIPMAAGEVLVVSHGGLLKELVTHFIEDFQCKVPGGKSHALRICPNTGVSRFMVTLSLQR